jgi:hypothetical protein
MVPASYHSFFSDAAQVAGTLIGLLFVAVSLTPERLGGNDADFQVKAGIAFAALVNGLVIGLIAQLRGPSRDIALPLAPAPATARATCLQMAIMRAVGPRRVPLLRGGPAAVSAGCLDSRGSLAPPTSKRCRTALWSLMAALPRPAPIGHIVISASRDAWQCTWPHELRSPSPNDRLLSPKRRRAVALGQVRWYGQSGQLVLAPPYFAGGGPVGDHLEFCFRADGINYAITLHSWAPLAQVSATLKRLVGSALSK